jgi:hypothetical protein
LLAVSGLALLALAVGGVGWYYSTRLQAALGDASGQRDLAEQAKAEAESARGAEEFQRRRAEDAQHEQEALLYFMSIERAHSAWRESEYPRMLAILGQCDPGRRQWEWRYLWQLGHSELLTFQEHTGPVLGVSWSPDGTHLASASGDQTVKVWDARTGQQVVTLKGHAGAVRGVSWSPDGTRLASASDDGTVKVWDGWAGREALTFKGHTGVVWGVAWSPDGSRLASVGGTIPSVI